MVRAGPITPPLRRARRWRRVRRVVPLVILLFVAVFLLAFISARAARAIVEVRAARQVEAGERVGVRSWMTISYIARVYGVPEQDLLATLGLSNTDQHRRAPLRMIAEREGRNLDADLASLNGLLDTRRPPPSAPPRPPGSP